MGDPIVEWPIEPNGELLDATGGGGATSDWKPMANKRRVTLFINVTVGTCTIYTREGQDENYKQPFAAYGVGVQMVTIDFSGDFQVVLSDTGRVDYAAQEF